MGKTKIIRVTLVDDDPEIHEIVSTILRLTGDIELTGAGNNGAEALSLCMKLHPHILLLDVMMPVMDGIETAQQMRSQMPQVKILVLSSFQDHDTVQAMMQSKVDGYVDKGSLFRDLASTIRAIYQGEKVFSGEALSSIFTPVEPREINNFDLSPRQMEILKLLATGFNKPKIALKLGIQESTVKFHVENICAKLGVNTRAEALIVAAKNRLV